MLDTDEKAPDGPLTGYFVEKMMRDPNSIVFKAAAVFCIAKAQEMAVALANFLFVIEQAWREEMSRDDSKVVSVDNDSSDDREQKQAALIREITQPDEKIKGLDKALVELQKKLAQHEVVLDKGTKAQLEHLEKTFGLTKTDQQSLSKSYDIIVKQAEMALPQELEGEAKEKLVHNRAGVGIEMNLLIKSLGDDFLPSKVKEFLKTYKDSVNTYVGLEKANYLTAREIEKTKAEIGVLEAVSGMVKGYEALAKNIPVPPPRPNPLSTKPHPPGTK